MKCTAQARKIRRCQALLRQRHNQFKVLPEVAQIDKPLKPGFAFALTFVFPAQPFRAALLQIGKACVERLHISTFCAQQTRQAEIAAHIRMQQTNRRQQPRPRRHQHLAHTHIARHVCGMQRPGTAKRHQREIARIFALLNRYHTHRTHHIDVDDFYDARSCLYSIHAQRCGKLINGRMGLVGMHGHAPAEQRFRTQAPQHHIGIGHGCLGTTTTVGRWARIRARTLRPHFK